MDAQKPKRWHPKLLRGPEGWTVGMVPAKHGDWLRASDVPAAPDMAELVEAAPDADVALMLELIAAGQELASKAAGVSLGDDTKDLIPLVNKWCAALAKIKEPQT